MKLLLKRLALLVAIFGVAIAFVGCNETTTAAQTTAGETTTAAAETTTGEQTTAVDLFATVPGRIIIDGSDQITGNFLLPGEVLGVTITYESSNTAVATISETTNADGFYTVYITTPSIPAGGVNTSVVITGTMSYGGDTDTFTKTIRVIAQNIISVNNIAEVHANASLNDVVEVTGIVYSLFSGGFFIYDETGTLGVYDSSVEVAVGDEITLKGTYANYYTLYQLADIADYTIESTGNTITLDPVVLGNGAYIAEADSSDRTLNGTVFTVTALLEERTNTSGYTNMYLVDIDGNAIAQIYHYSMADSLTVLQDFLDDIITLNVVYYTDHGDVVYVSFYGTAADVTVTDEIDFYAKALEIGSIFVNNNTATLPDSVGPADVTWAPGTGETNLTVANGNEVTFADVTEDTEAVLTATVSYTPEGGTEATTTVDFTVTILDLTEADLVARDKTDLMLILTPDQLSEVALPSEGAMGSDITWAVGSGAATIDGNYITFEYVGAAYTVMLTATITNGAASDTKNFMVSVAAATVTSMADALAGEIGDEFLVKGVVYYTIQSGFYVQDETGKLFVYYGTTPPVELGDEVAIRGTLATYHGSLQLSNYPLVSSVISTGNDIAQTPVEAYDPASTTLDAGQTYTVTGTISYGPVVDGGYDNLYFADASDDPLVMIYYKADADSYALLRALEGYNVTLDLVYYNEDAISMFVWMGTADDLTVNGLTDAELAEAALLSVTLPSTVTVNTTLNFPASAFGSVDLTYSSDDTAVITNAGVVTVTEGEQTTVTITVTADANGTTDTLDIEVQVGDLEVSDLVGIYDGTFELGDMIKVQGIMTAQTRASAAWIQDTTAGANLYIPSDLRTEFAALAPGIEIEVVGYVATYNGLMELSNFTYTVLNETPALPDTVDITNMELTSDGLYDYMGQLVTLVGFSLSSAVTATSGNLYITLVNAEDPSITIPMTIYSDNPDYAAILAKLQGFATTDVLIFDGAILSWYNHPEIMVSNASQIIEATDAALLTYDHDNLSIALTANAQQTVVLPLAGKMGSTIAWTVNSGDVTLGIDGKTLTFNNTAEADYTVSLTATLTLGTETAQTVDFTINVMGYEAVTDLSTLSAQTDGVWDIAEDTYVYAQGVITGFGYNVIYIQDASGNGFAMYKADGYHNDGTVNVGDEVVYYGKLDDYPGTRQFASGADLIAVVSTGNTVTSNTMTLDEVIAITVQDGGKVITVTGLTLTSLNSSGYIIFTATGSSSSIQIEMYDNGSFDWVDALYNEGDTLPAFTFTFIKFYTTLLAVELGSIEFTDQQRTDLDAAELDATLSTLSADYEIPTGTYGSDYVVTAVSAELTAYVDYTTTTGWLLITQPTDADAVGTITFSATNEATSTSVTVDITVPKWVPTELIISEYVENGNDKAIEIYNPTDAAIDLSGYELRVYSNGNTSYSTIALTGTLNAGEVFVVAYTSAAAAIQAVADMTSGSLSFNGNDVVALALAGGDNIDQLGTIGSSAVFAEDCSLTRNTDVLVGTLTFDLGEWTDLGDGVYTNLGAYTA
ncbi:MAG: lamin tail domain-containing protein [Bacilli bacterium]|nr:lamin tail domain-containing protein [Bacilli bacterium]